MPKQFQGKGHSGGKGHPGVSKSAGKKHTAASSGGGARSKTGRIPGAANLSGPLQDRLKGHAFERCRHFFLFVTTLKQIEYLNNSSGRVPINAASFFERKATHQIDDGFRSDNPEHVDFRRGDVSIVDENSTAFKKVDAAHYCNLGIRPALAASIDTSNPVVFELYENLKVFAGNTTWLPQIVNIGPDRIIDVVHGDFAEAVLKDTANAVCSRTRIKEYVNRATIAMGNYILGQIKSKNHGKVACSNCYLTAYTEKTSITFGETKQVVLDQPDFVERIFASMSGSIAGWCHATGNGNAISRFLSFN